ncbi:co-chaperone protein daf-41-like [Clavelina lepadiformis]|uniref:CS domain-containing protein n=1 Tax=Clavelina lepadiformis TaxID=159417 RepID=A0ABP0GT43_CLALP
MTQSQDMNGKGDAEVTHPAPTLWAQRKDVVFLTFKIESCKTPQVSFEKDKVTFTGTDHSTVTHYANTIEMNDEIKPEGCIWAKKGLGIECTLQKKNIGFWPRLTKDKAKIHWLRVDFNKWKDEDDSSDDEGRQEEPDLSNLMAQMGGGAGGIPDMGDLPDDEEVDSDDEDLPDLEDNVDKEDKPESA